MTYPLAIVLLSLCIVIALGIHQIMMQKRINKALREASRTIEAIRREMEIERGGDEIEITSVSDEMGVNRYRNVKTGEERVEHSRPNGF